MSNESAHILLEKKLGKQDNEESLTSLAEALEYMPLAIVQAASYITQRAPRCSIRQYLDDFQRSDRKKARLLDYEAGQLRRDIDAKNSIIITWQISFDHIRQIRPSAADLLSLMSFFDRQGIPEALLRGGNMPEDHLRSEDEPNRRSIDDTVDDESSASDQSSVIDGAFEDDILTLRNYSFISIMAGGENFEMHRLVQLSMRKWLEISGQHEKWKTQFIARLNAKFPVGKYENWAICQPLFPHVKSAVMQKPEEQSLLIEWANLLHKAGWYAKESGNWSDAKDMTVRSVKALKRVLGAGHPNTLECMNTLSVVWSTQGQWDLAEELQSHVLEVRKDKLGMDHPDTLSIMNNLAVTYFNQNRFDMAEELDMQVLKLAEDKLGTDNPYMIDSMNNIAVIWSYQGHPDLAEKLHKKVLELRKNRLGPDHPETLLSMSNLAATYAKQGRWDMAEELQTKVLELNKKTLGSDHPDVLGSMNNLASFYRGQGRLDMAEELQIKVLELYKNKFGPCNHYTLLVMYSMAFTLYEKGQHTEAIALMTQCVSLRRRVLGEGHPLYKRSVYTLTQWEKEQGIANGLEELSIERGKSATTWIWWMKYYIEDVVGCKMT